MIDIINNRDFLNTLNFDEIMLIDVRTTEEFSDGYIEGAINIPLHELRERAQEIDFNKKLYVYCAKGVRSAIACEILEKLGYKKIYDISCGYNALNM